MNRRIKLEIALWRDESPTRTISTTLVVSIERRLTHKKNI